MRIAVVSFKEILHRSHHGDGQLRTVLHKTRLIERFAVFACDGEFDASHVGFYAAFFFVVRAADFFDFLGVLFDS